MNKDRLQTERLKSRKDEGVFDKALNKWQGFNKLTFKGGALVAGAGILVGSVATATVGAGVMLVDGIQIHVIDRYKDWKKRRQLNVRKQQLSPQPS